MKKTDDFEGYVVSPKGLRKGAMVSGQEYRRENRDRKVEFPNKKRNEEARRPKRVAAGKPQEKVAERVPDIKGDEEFVSVERYLETVTEEQEARLMAREVQERAVRRMEEAEKQQEYDLVLDCELVFPEEEEEQE